MSSWRSLFVVGLVLLASTSSWGCSASGDPGADVADTLALDSDNIEIDSQGIDSIQDIEELDPWVTSTSDQVRPAADWPWLASVSIRSGGLGCLNNYYWGEETCIQEINIRDLRTGILKGTYREAAQGASPQIQDGLVMWMGQESIQVLLDIEEGTLTKPLEQDPLFNNGIRFQAILRQGSIYWMGNYQPDWYWKLYRYNHATGKVSSFNLVQDYRIPYYISDTGASSQPHFDVDGDFLAFLFQAPDPTGNYRYQVRVVELSSGEEVFSTENEEYNHIWPRLQGDWLYYYRFSEDEWDCYSSSCSYTVVRISLTTGAEEILSGEEVLVSGFMPPIPLEQGIGWLDYSEGAYQLRLQSLDQTWDSTSPLSRPLGILSGGTMTDSPDGPVMIWSSLTEPENLMQLFRYSGGD